MSETTTETPEPPAEGTPTVPELAAKVDAQESKLDKILGMLTGHGAESPAEPEAEDAKSIAQREARQAVQDLQRREQAKAKRDAAAGELKALRDKVDKITEKAPREYRKVERFMRWDKDDK